MTSSKEGNESYLPNSLQPAQIEALAALHDAHKDGIEKGYINMATGTGKTHVAAHDVRGFLDRNPGAQVLYLCHNTDILRQARETFTSVLGGETHGNFFGGEFEAEEDITYATFQTMGTKVEDEHFFRVFDPKKFNYVVVDESHHGPAETYRPVIGYFQPDFLLGLTATPQRSDQQDIAEIFGAELYTLQLDEAIALGYVVQPDYRVLSDHVRRLEEFSSGLSEISLKDLDRTIFVPRQDDEIAKLIAEHIDGYENPRTIVFCSSIAHAERMKDLLPGRVETLHSNLNPKLQQARLTQFRSGELDMIVTVDKLNEGVDIPEANIIVFLRSTESQTVFLQQLGRGLRRIPGKDKVLILDFVASWGRIRDVQSLKRDVLRAYNEQVESEYTGTNPKRSPFNFEFSEEVMRAVELIQHARQKRLQPKTVEPRSRYEKWATEEAELKAMLGISSLPNQRTSEHQWRLFADRLAKGDSRVKEEILMCHLREMYGTAKQFARTLDSAELTVEDHFQNAYLGLQRALESFDPTQHEALRNYAQLAIFGGLARGAYGRGQWLTTTGQQKVDIVKKSRQKLSKKMGGLAASEITYEELVAETRFNAKEIERLEALSYEASVPIDEAADQLFDPRYSESMLIEFAARAERNRNLRHMLDGLSHRDRRVLELRYGLAGEQRRTLDEIGRMFDVTRERVRQIETAALKELAENEGAYKLYHVEE